MSQEASSKKPAVTSTPAIELPAAHKREYGKEKDEAEKVAILNKKVEKGEPIGAPAMDEAEMQPAIG